MAKELKQPSWCCYPDADAAIFGCWSLLEGMVTDEEYCRECDCHKDEVIATGAEIEVIATLTGRKR